MAKKNIDNSNIAIRRTSTIKLVLLSILTLGFYWYVWLWKLITDINKLYPTKYIHRCKWFAALILTECLSIYMNIKGIQESFIINGADVIWNIIHLLLALQILKNIENYVKNEFDLDIKHNPLGWLFFGCFYINAKINRLPQSIKNGIKKKLKELKENKD